MPRHSWGKLNKQRVGAYAEYFVKMELTMHGFQVYSPEVDDHGIDFVTRHTTGPFIEVQVKSARRTARGITNIAMQQAKLPIGEHVYVALAVLIDGKEPDLYLIPSMVWATPQPRSMFGSNSYGPGRVSKPEWSIKFSKRNEGELEHYRFDKSIESLLQPS